MSCKLIIVSAGVCLLPVDVVSCQFGAARRGKRGSMICCFLCWLVSDISAMWASLKLAEAVQPSAEGEVQSGFGYLVYRAPSGYGHVPIRFVSSFDKKICFWL